LVLLRAEIAVGDARKIAGQLGELVDLIGEVAGVTGSAARYNLKIQVKGKPSHLNRQVKW